jgi:hypothetical protein
MQVLGVPKDADGNLVEKAYKRKKQEAETARDKSKLAKIEDAHNQIFMASLTARLSVRCSVDVNNHQDIAILVMGLDNSSPLGCLPHPQCACA